mgnify:CR=1 FL=1
MLKTRVITAVILLIVLLAVLMYGGAIGWNLFVLLVLVGAFWEWARLGQFQSGRAIAYSTVGSALCVFAAMFLNVESQSYPVLALASIFWVAFAPWCLRNVSIGKLANPTIFAVVGFVLIAAAGLALVIAKTFGVVFLISASTFPSTWQSHRAADRRGGIRQSTSRCPNPAGAGFPSTAPG